MLNQPLSAIYKDIARIPVTIQVDDALCEGHKIPVTAATLHGTANVIPAFIHTSGTKAPHLVVHGGVWEFAGVPSKETKSKFPIWIRVWNYIVNFVSVTAQVEHSRDIVKIYSEGVVDSGEQQVIYLVMSNNAKDNEKVWVTGTAIESQDTPFVIFRILPWLRDTVFTKAAPARILKKVKGIIRPSGNLSVARQAVLRTSTIVGALATKSIRFGVRTKEIVMTFNLKASIWHQLERIVKAVARTRAQLKTIVPLKIRTQREWLYLRGNMLVKTVKNSLIAKPLLKVFVLPPALRKVIAHTWVSVSSPAQKAIAFIRTQTRQSTQEWKSLLQVRVRNVSLAKVVAYLKSDLSWWEVTKKPFKIIADVPRKATRTVMTFWQSIKKTRVVNVRGAIQKAVRQNKLRLDINIPKVIRWLRLPLLPKVKKQAKVVVPVRYKTERESKILLLTNRAVVKTLMEWGVLASMEKANLHFVVRPYSSLYKLRIMASLNQTFARSFIAVQTSKAEAALRTTFNTCSYFRSGLIQWYLHRNLVSNEGFSNEIVFDLDSLDPVGPIPPAPTEQWKGGYVDYPFKGAGQESIDDASGYLSPEGEEWVKNVKMIWSKPTDIFEGEE